MAPFHDDGYNQPKLWSVAKAFENSANFVAVRDEVRGRNYAVRRDDLVNSIYAAPKSGYTVYTA